MKYCWNCRQEKALEEFYKNKSRKDGLSTECKDCAKRLSNEYIKNNYEKVQAYWLMTTEQRKERTKKKYDERSDELYLLRRTLRHRYYSLKSGARVRKIFFALTFDQYVEIINNPCYYCGISIFGIAGTSVDRINNDKKIGYQLGNILPCCGPCNQTRGQHWSVDEAQIMIQAALKYRKEHTKE